MRQFSIVITWGKVPEHEQQPTDGQMQSTVEPADPLNRDQPGFGPPSRTERSPT